MASGAGLNKIDREGGRILLQCTPSATAVTDPTSTAYGTISLNDSGLQMLDGSGFTKWTFQLDPVDDYEVTLYGTVSQSAYVPWPFAGSVAVPAGSWFKLPAPSEQGGAGTVANPINSVTPLLVCSLPLVAVRAVLTAVGSPNGACSVIGFAVP